MPSPRRSSPSPSPRSSVPGPRSRALAEALARVECPALTARRARRAEQAGADRDPISWHRTRGAEVEDADGNVFVDFTGGFGVALFGHGHPRVVEAVQAQAGQLMHALGDVHPSDVKVALLERLTSLAPWPARAILGLSGADAVEAALKTAALHTGRPGVVAFSGGYHGLSHGPLAVCGYGEKFRAPFAAQLNPHVRFAPFPAPDASVEDAIATAAQALAALDEQAGAVIVEPIQGRGGLHVPPPGFLQALAALCRREGVLLIVDEIYTGLGRTGPRWQHVAQGGEADLICAGKALGGGLPISACLGREAVMAAWGDPAGEAIHTSTFNGNPLSCAAALAFLEVLQREEAQVQKAGATLRHALEALAAERGGHVRGEGLLLGYAPADPSRVLPSMGALIEHGYLVLPAGSPPDVLCFTPPACVSEMQIRGMCDALRQVLGEEAPTR